MSEDAASAAGQAAEIAVHHAQEEQEIRDTAESAVALSEAAAIVSESAANVSTEALDHSANAEESATVATAIAVESAETANQAGAVATEAKSEIQQLREELWPKIDEILGIISKPPETETAVTEIETGDLHGNQSAESGDTGTGTDTGTDKGSAGTNNSGEGSGTTPTKKAGTPTQDKSRRHKFGRR